MNDLLYDDLIIGVNDHNSLGSGWHQLEDWPPCIRWTHKISVAYLKKAKNSSQLCFKLYTGIKKNEVLIYLNDKNYREYELCPANFQIIRVPLIRSDEMKYLKVTIEVKETWIPDKVIKNGDLRSLGVAVERIWQE
jgi:hypothetical protein